MDLFSAAFQKVLAPYLFVLAGFVAGRVLTTRKEHLAELLIYMITPVVVFSGVVKAQLDFQYLFLPVLFFLFCSSICLGALRLAGRFFEQPAPNILGFASGNANSGYFAIPVGIALFGDQALSAIILCSFGFILFENTVGFYISARGNHTKAESFRKVMKLPAVYAFAAGLTANLAGMVLQGPLIDVCTNVRGAYSVLGMMMIGLAVADLKSFRVDAGFTLFACLMKFGVWPLAMWTLLAIEETLFNIFPPELRLVIFFMSTLPLAASL